MKWQAIVRGNLALPRHSFAPVFGLGIAHAHRCDWEAALRAIWRKKYT
jgi:hypothetical protein